MLKLTNIHTYYGAIQALNDVSVEVNKGEIVTLIGANGAGKTTLLMTVCGSPRARSGTVEFLGEDITQWPTHSIMQKGIAISPEGRRVFPDLTVTENLKMGAFFLDREHTEAGLERVFALFPRLKERSSQRAGTMSGGEQQMLAMARILRTGAELLLLDEITEGLAPVIVERLGEVLVQLKARGYTILLVEQNFHFTAPIADRHYVIEHGRVVKTATSGTLAAQRAEIARLLGV